MNLVIGINWGIIYISTNLVKIIKNGSAKKEIHVNE
jgi:hypothetical protein